MSRRHFRAARRASAGLLVALLALPAAAQGRQDSVLFVDARGTAKSFRGVLKENSLSRVVIESEGRDRSVDSTDVSRVVFGEVPPSFSDATAYSDRDDFENAARQFEVAATDASARDVVQAAARMRAAVSWMRHGSTDAASFGQARTNFERFLADHPDNREVPRARALLGRATWMAGDPAAAGEVFRSLYQEVAGGEPGAGYSYLDGYAAGLAGANAFLAAGDAETARTLFSELATGLGTVLASLEEGAPLRRSLADVQADARLGEGFCLLAAGTVPQARTFFQRQLGDPQASSVQRFGAQLGLAEALLADGDVRKAQIEFAQVSALDHTNRDRVGRALVGLAECALRLSDSDARQNAKLWLDTVRDQYGDTPSALRAQELSQTL